MNELPFVLTFGGIIRIGALLFLGVPVVKWCSKKAAALGAKRYSQHIGLLAEHLIFYGGLVFIVVTVLHELGFHIAALLGAAGVLGVAIGFAAQTSIANIISGFFLLVEQPFSVGDIIKSVDVVGVVESIDLLAVRVRTLDNRMVRLPNEAVLKQSLINLSYYPHKRVDCVVSVPYEQNILVTINTIQDVIKNNQLFLVSPAPTVTVLKIANRGDGCAELRLFFTVRVWVVQEKFLLAPSVLIQQLKLTFDNKEVAITVCQIN